MGFTENQMNKIQKQVDAHDEVLEHIQIKMRNSDRLVEDLRMREEELIIKLGVMRNQVSEHEKALYKLEHIDALLKDNERYVGYVLPIKI